MNFPGKRAAANAWLWGALALLALSAATAGTADSKRVEIRNGWFYVDGEKFFIKGVCYFEQHAIDGKIVKNPPEMIDRDFAMIKRAGFNTVKSLLTAEQIELARKHGLMVVNPALFSCFNSDYRTPSHLAQFSRQIDEFVGYGKRFDNLLYYTMDNEPCVHAVHRQGRKFMEEAWRAWDRKVKKLQPGAFTSVQMMPPTDFADVSMCDVASLNLYPFNPANNSIGYGSYAEWYKRAHAPQKPLVISEYGSTTSEDPLRFGPPMLNLIDQQIKAGLQGSFFYIWRAFGGEREGDNGWWGFIPTNGKPGDTNNAPRPIYDEYRKYFEAVAIEPKAEGVYVKTIPFEIYGTDRTASMSASINGRTIPLQKKGRYWWVGESAFGRADFGSRVVTIEAKDKEGRTLVKKEVAVRLAERKRTLSAKILRESKTLKKGDTYRATVVVVDERGRSSPNTPLNLGLNQSRVDLWSSIGYQRATDAKGEYRFQFEGVSEGYLHLMAGVDARDPDVETFADVDVISVSRAPEADPNAPSVVLEEMDLPSCWSPFMEIDARLSLAADSYYSVGEKRSIDGIELSYDLGARANWVSMCGQVGYDLSPYKALRITFRDTGIRDLIQVELVDLDDSHFQTRMDTRSKDGQWTTATLPLEKFTHAWGGDRKLDRTDVRINFVIQRKAGTESTPGRLTISRLEAVR